MESTKDLRTVFYGVLFAGAAGVGIGSLINYELEQAEIRRNQESTVLRYSAGNLVYAGIAKGEVSSHHQYDGIKFTDKCKGNQKVHLTDGAEVTTVPHGTILSCDDLPQPNVR